MMLEIEFKDSSELTLINKSNIMIEKDRNIRYLN